MSKAILEFDLSNHDDQMEFRRAASSLNMALSLWEMLYNTKKTFERELEASETSTESHYELLDSVYKRFWEILGEHGVNIDNLVE